MRKLRQNLNLLSVLCRANFRSSDYRSFAGALWSFMGPLIVFSVTYFIFVDRFGRHISYFPLTLLSGIITISYFSNTITYTMRFFPAHREILMNSRAPSSVLLPASLFVPSIKFFVEFTLCIIIAFSLRILEPQKLAVALALIPFLILLAVGIGLCLAVLSQLAGDVREIWLVFSQMLLFTTPIFYQLPMISPLARTLIVFFNPVTPFILSFQSLLTGHPVPYFHTGTLVQAAAYGLASFFTGWTYFKRMERQMVEKL